MDYEIFLDEDYNHLKLTQIVNSDIVNVEKNIIAIYFAQNLKRFTRTYTFRKNQRIMVRFSFTQFYTINLLNGGFKVNALNRMDLDNSTRMVFVFLFFEINYHFYAVRFDIKIAVRLSDQIYVLYY